jgi:hypothetical protein
LKKRFNRKWQGLQKLVAVAGGLMILVGVVLFGMAILASSGFLNVGLMFEGKYLVTFAFLVVLAGLFDAFAAVIIARW